MSSLHLKMVRRLSLLPDRRCRGQHRRTEKIVPETLLRSGSHEFLCAGSGAEAATLAFALDMASRAKTIRGAEICVCFLAAELQESGTPYGLCFRGSALSADKLLMVCVRKEQQLLWTLEEALASQAFAAVIGALGATERLYGFGASRRLKLRAVETGTPLYLLRHHSQGGATAAHGRWRIASAPSHAAGAYAGFELPGAHRLRLNLEKFGGLPPQQWELEYDVARGFHMAAVLPDRVDRAADGGRRQALRA